jgi:hypothetical protein
MYGRYVHIDMLTKDDRMKINQDAYKFRYIYGPVPSWRVGSSLGIDLLSQKGKICSFDCLYCQLGKTKITTATRQLYVSVDDILKELDMLPEDISIDYLTLSGRGGTHSDKKYRGHDQAPEEGAKRAGRCYHQLITYEQAGCS